MVKPPTEPRRRALLWIVGGIAAVTLIVTVVLSATGGDAGPQFGDPVVAGAPLPPLQDAGDAALGSTIPEVTGADFDGNPVAITLDGRPKILIFLAHWCSHCQAEVPVLQSLVDEGRLPDGIDLIGVATSTAETRPNFPPSAWLDREGWSSPTIVDDADYSVARAYGLSAFPFWVFVDADGTVLGRVTGEIPGDAVVDIANGILEGS